MIYVLNCVEIFFVTLYRKKFLKALSSELLAVYVSMAFSIGYFISIPLLTSVTNQWQSSTIRHQHIGSPSWADIVFCKSRVY